MAHPDIVAGECTLGSVPDTSVRPCHRASMSFSTPKSTVPFLRLSKGPENPQCCTRTRNSCYQTSTVPRFYCSSPVASMSTLSNRKPFLEALKTVIINALPNVSIESIQPTPIARLQRDVHIKTSDGTTLMLTLPPHQMLKLLRSEQWLVLSEALIIPWMCRRLEQTARAQAIPISYLINTEPPSDIATNATNTKATPRRFQTSETSFIQTIPDLISHSSASSELGTAFNLMELPPGLPIASLPKPLSQAERSILEYQKGKFVRSISDLTEPNSKFGLIVAVLGSQTSQPADPSFTTAVVGSGGTDSWSSAFLALVEGTLRDGEDRAVTISYSQIRRHMHRLSHLLDAVTQPRLVILDAGSDSNILVSSSKGLNSLVRTHSSLGKPCGRYTCSDAEERDEFGFTGKGGKALHSEETQMKSVEGRTGAMKSGDNHRMSVTGLRDWSNCIFGDPLLTSIFSEDPSPEFIRGFRQQTLSPVTSSSETAVSSRESSPPPDDIVEDRENAAVRLLLYECYHASVCLVKQFYRPTGADGTKREMEARRRLATALNKLSEVDETATKRHRKASADIWPVKKAKIQP